MNDAQLRGIVKNQIDSTTNAQTIVSYDHHEVHAGSFFSVYNTQSVSTTTFKWQVTTPNTDVLAHLQFGVACTGEMTALVTEGSDRTDGTAITEINHHRSSTNTAGVVVTHTPTGGTTDGAVTLFSLRDGATGVASKTIASGSGRATNEYILKKNTKYVISVTTYAAVYVTLELDWYEHEDSN